MDAVSIELLFGTGLFAVGVVRAARHALLRRISLRRLHTHCA